MLLKYYLVFKWTVFLNPLLKPQVVDRVHFIASINTYYLYRCRIESLHTVAMFSIRPRFLSRARKLSCLPLKSMGNGEWKVSCLLVSSLCVLSHSDTSDSFGTPWTVAHQAPLSMGIFQARILEWVAMPSSKGSSWLRDWTQVSHIAGGFFTVLATWQYSAAWVKSHKAFFTQGASLVAQMVKNPPAMQETWHLSLGQEDPLAKGMATHSYILAWRIPWIEEPDGLQSMGSQRRQIQLSN